VQSQLKIFSQTVRDCMRPAQVVIPASTGIAEMLGRMSGVRTNSALITDQDGRLLGLITEQDVSRRIALRCEGGDPVSSVMTSPVEAVHVDDFLYRAIVRMRRFGWHHMPVVDAEERPVGEILLSDALAVAAEQALHQIDLVARGASIDGLRDVKAAQAEIAAELLRDHVPVPEIQALITDINRGIHRRILENQLAAMKDADWGAPPVPFTLLIMGSGGRGENFLFPDQDNGFILDDYPDAKHTKIDAFFIELAERMTRDLDTVGFPYCNGYVMATNPLWRKTRTQWREQLNIWGRRRGAIAVQLSDIFFDFRHGYGRTDFARGLRRDASAMVRNSPAYLQAIEAELYGHGVALGWFGRFVTVSGKDAKKENIGKINLKHAGTLPLVGAVRLLALREGVAETATLKRIAALHKAGVLSGNEADYLRGAFKHVTFLLLRQQLADFRAGETVGNHVHPDNLTEREKDILVDSLKAIDDLRKRVHGEFTGDVF
jgi:CBS domain-containing protein